MYELGYSVAFLSLLTLAQNSLASESADGLRELGLLRRSVAAGFSVLQTAFEQRPAGFGGARSAFMGYVEHGVGGRPTGSAPVHSADSSIYPIQAAHAAPGLTPAARPSPAGSPR